jgi:hypothetical protein
MHSGKKLGPTATSGKQSHQVCEQACENKWGWFTIIVLEKGFLDQRPQVTTMALCNGLSSGFSLVLGCTEFWQAHFFGFFNHSMQAGLAVKRQAGLEVL